MLKDQIQADVSTALKDGDHKLVGVLRLALSAINSKEKEKRYKLTKDKQLLSEEAAAKESQLTDDEIISVLYSEIKKRKDAIVLYEKGNRPELAGKEKEEIEILKKYLPRQLEPDELRKLIEQSINKVGAKELKDTGKIMADLLPKVKGAADGSQINKLIREILND